MRSPAFTAAAREAARLMRLPAFRGDADSLPRRLLRRCDRRMTQVAGWQHFFRYQGVFRARAYRERG
jgi:hypothetical protein